MKLNRPAFLMNEADSSPGGGGTSAPASPAATAGAGSPVAPSTTDITSAVAAQLAEFKNGFFADLRKAGALKQEKPTVEHPPPGAMPQQLPGSPSASGLSMADVESMLERERVITARSVEHRLTDAQVKRMKSALAGTSVDAFAAEADSYLSEMGLVKAPTAAPAASSTVTSSVAPAHPPAAAPAAPSAHALPTANGVVDLFNLTDPQLGALGPQGVRENLEKLWIIGNQSSGQPVRPKPPSQR